MRLSSSRWVKICPFASRSARFHAAAHPPPSAWISLILASLAAEERTKSAVSSVLASSTIAASQFSWVSRSSKFNARLRSSRLVPSRRDRQKNQGSTTQTSALQVRSTRQSA